MGRIVLLSLLLLATSCRGDVEVTESITPTPARPTTAASLGAPPQVATPPGLLSISRQAPTAPGPGGPAVGSIRAGVVVPFDHLESGWARILTPCENKFWIPIDHGSITKHAEVMLDPGHGGDEPGAVGPGGLAEKEVNLDIAARTEKLLERDGISGALTRTSDYRATLAFRVAAATAAGARLLVSIHHNADPDGPRPRPGSETFYQYSSSQSRRLAGLLYEETVDALAGFPAEWVGDTDAGAKWRISSSGADYYGILRLGGQAGVTSVLAESAFISNPSEEALLRRDDVRQAEAGALSRAILRFLRTNDPGTGFTTPYPRTVPAGPGGGRSGCRDPV